jgi:hypothetical protein
LGKGVLLLRSTIGCSDDPCKPHGAACVCVAPRSGCAAGCSDGDPMFKCIKYVTYDLTTTTSGRRRLTVGKSGVSVELRPSVSCFGGD